MSDGGFQLPDHMKWWAHDRFGLFIHWGLYAQAARHEWVKSHEQIPDREYQKYFGLFDPDLYDPWEWARAAREAGMKYFVVTTKHHEGFCLWDSAFTDYKAPSAPCGRDLIAPMVEAFREEGLKVGFYYSLIDWHHPEYTADRFHPQRNDAAFREQSRQRDMRKYAEYMRNQVGELLTRFGRIDVLFLDFSFPGEDGKGCADWESEELLEVVRQAQPDIILNDRLDLMAVPGGWDFRTPEQFMVRDWVTYDGRRVPWETCQTFSGSWGYHRDENTWKSVEQLLYLLIDTVSKGGNLLLNVGPTARGQFDGRALERLAGIGRWMKQHGRAIYGCTQAPEEFPTPPDCRLTWNADARRLYIHLLNWPIKDLFLPGLGGKVKYAQLLNDASEVKMSKRAEWQAGWEGGTTDTLMLELPVLKPDVAIPVVELFLE
jgi:alpha-L-fucosidase